MLKLVFLLHCFYSSGANAKDLQVSDLAATPLILEMNFLRNHTGIMKAKAEAQSALVKERADFARIKLEMTRNKATIDRLEKTIRALQAEKTNLQSNRTALGKKGSENEIKYSWNAQM